MKRAILWLVCLASIACTVPAFAAGEKPFNLALFNPAQIYDESTPIAGLRLNLIYGKNSSMSGLDLGLVNVSSGQFTGWQYGAVGLVEGPFLGWQDSGFANIVNGEARALQTGIYNHAEQMIGVQIGFVNTSTSMHGFALAVVNYTNELRGLQIGLINVANDLKGHPVLPIVNFSF